jgi:hypothetical protein
MNDQLYIADCDFGRLRPDGFVEPLGSDVSFIFRLINGLTLERRLASEWLTRRTAVSLSMSGDGIGSIFYKAELMRGHNPSVSQDIETLELLAELAPAGLQLRLAGTLHGIKAEYIEKARAEIEKSQGKRLEPKWLSEPWERFSVDVLVPWMWLLVRGSSLVKYRPNLAAATSQLIAP